LGEGGSADVYSGHITCDQGKVQPCAVKIAKDKWFRNDGFEREIFYLHGISDPSLPRLYEWQLEPLQRSIIVMEYLEGLALHVCVRDNKERTLPLRVVIEIVADIAATLDRLLNVASDNQGRLWRLVVGDIKPNNVILTATGVKIFDLGLARSALDTSSIMRNQPARAVGTPSYMAPEQHFEGPPSPEADIYSLGVMMVELILGQFVELRDHIYYLPVTLAKVAASLSGDIEQELMGILQGLLSFAPEERWQARQAAMALQDLADKLPGPTMAEFIQSATYRSIVSEQYESLRGRTVFRNLPESMRFSQHRVTKG
jgi:serine/threonine protein kinase